MADAVKKYITNPQLALQLAMKGRKKSESFDWDNIKKLWIDVINQHD